MYYDMSYILCDWKLGWWEIGAKIFVFQEVYETLLYLLAPFVIPISFATRPVFSSYLYAATITMYAVNALVFNYVSLCLYVVSSPPPIHATPLLTFLIGPPAIPQADRPFQSLPLLQPLQVGFGLREHRLLLLCHLDLRNVLRETPPKGHRRRQGRRDCVEFGTKGNLSVGTGRD